MSLLLSLQISSRVTGLDAGNVDYFEVKARVIQTYLTIYRSNLLNHPIGSLPFGSQFGSKRLLCLEEFTPWLCLVLQIPGIVCVCHYFTFQVCQTVWKTKETNYDPWSVRCLDVSGFYRWQNVVGHPRSTLTGIPSFAVSVRFYVFPDGQREGRSGNTPRAASGTRQI